MPTGKKEAAPGAKPAATSGARSHRSVVAGDGHRGGACRKGVVAAAPIGRERETERARRRRVETQKAREVGAEAVVYICLLGF